MIVREIERSRFGVWYAAGGGILAKYTAFFLFITG